MSNYAGVDWAADKRDVRVCDATGKELLAATFALHTAAMVGAAAELADETGFESVSLAALAERLGVKPPALYKHVDGISDLRHRVATLAMSELADALRDALQGKSGPGRGPRALHGASLVHRRTSRSLQRDDRYTVRRKRRSADRRRHTGAWLGPRSSVRLRNSRR